jgi:putative transposase
VRKQHGPLRADTLRQSMNSAKEATVLDFIGDYRELAVQIGRVQWRLFFEKGGTNKYAPAKHLNGLCGAAPVQMASYQVQEQIDGWVSNRANEFVDCVRHSKLADATKAQLYAINRKAAWFSRDGIEGIAAPVRALARSIMRHVMGKHRHPDLSRISPRLDSRVATVAPPKKDGYADLWATLRLPNRGTIAIPLHGNPLFNQRGGELCPVVQLCTDADSVTIRLVQDMAKPFAALKAAYEPKIDSLGIDFGLSALAATSEGTMFGVRLIDDLKRIDKQIVGIARHRMRSGGKPRDSQCYRTLVTRVRGMLKTRINAALNSIVRIHAPAALVVERLDFRFPGLSRRMNRLITNCGRAVFRAKLADLKDKYGIAASDVPAPYTSQECSSCHYVDAANRPSQTKFACRWCGNATHADVDAARAVNQRRSLGLGTKWLTKGAILAVLVGQHIKRWPLVRSNGPPGATHDPRLPNPHFKGWADLARNALETQGVVPCV